MTSLTRRTALQGAMGLGVTAALQAGVATGFQFAPVDEATLEHTLARTAECFADQKLWRGLQKRGMEQDVSWGRSAAAYAQLYRNLVKA